MELIEQVARMDERMGAVERDIKEIKDTLADLDAKVTGRPSWPVTIYITLITSAFVGVLVAFLGAVRS